MNDLELDLDGYVRRCGPLTIERQGEAFHAVLVGAAGRVLITNEVGRLVLELCDGTRTGEQIIAEVSASCDQAPPEQVRRDVSGFLQQAAEKDVITWKE